MDFLRQRLAEEQANAEQANLARLEAETRCHLAEKERDVYRLLARRWKARLGSMLEERDGEDLIAVESIEEAAAAMLLGDRENISMFRLGGLLQHYRVLNGGAFDSEEDSDGSDDENEEMVEHNEADIMDEDEEEMNDGMLEDGDGDGDGDGEESVRSATAMESQDVAKSIEVRTVRTVSISNDSISSDDV